MDKVKSPHFDSFYSSTDSPPTYEPLPTFDVDSVTLSIPSSSNSSRALVRPYTKFLDTLDMNSSLKDCSGFTAMFLSFFLHAFPYLPLILTFPVFLIKSNRGYEIFVVCVCAGIICGGAWELHQLRAQRNSNKQCGYSSHLETSRVLIQLMWIRAGGCLVTVIFLQRVGRSKPSSEWLVALQSGAPFGFFALISIATFPFVATFLLKKYFDFEEKLGPPSPPPSPPSSRRSTINTPTVDDPGSTEDV